ncbi:MAG: small multi-drug export protein [Candidatus Woesearchaeota archaeon]|nr:MAG: small multi-drug export protein [Candidatus Woesearchaeota archaeon]
MLTKYFITFILSGTPVSECRGAIIYGLANGLNPWLVLILAIIGNIIVIPITFWLLKLAHFRKIIFRLFKERAVSKIKKYRKKFELYEELALLFFVAIPLPVTGGFTGILISEILDLNRKKATVVISIGVILAAIIVFIGSELGLLFFK